MDKYGFKFNPYYRFVANTIIEGEPLTLVFHVDDVKAIHKDTKAVENLNSGLNLCKDIQILEMLSQR